MRKKGPVLWERCGSITVFSCFDLASVSRVRITLAALKTGLQLNVVYPLLNIGLIEISRSRFK